MEVYYSEVNCKRMTRLSKNQTFNSFQPTTLLLPSFFYDLPYLIFQFGFSADNNWQFQLMLQFLSLFTAIFPTNFDCISNDFKIAFGSCDIKIFKNVNRNHFFQTDIFYIRASGNMIKQKGIKFLHFHYLFVLKNRYA